MTTKSPSARAKEATETASVAPVAAAETINPVIEVPVVPEPEVTEVPEGFMKVKCRHKGEGLIVSNEDPNAFYSKGDVFLIATEVGGKLAALDFVDPVDE